MFDVMIFAESAEAASRTLLSLVEGVVADMVKRVVVIAPESHAELAALADAAGCQILTLTPGADNNALLEQTLTTDHVLCLRAGAQMLQGWPELLKSELASRGMPGTAVAVLFRPEQMMDWLKLMFIQTVRGQFSLQHGALLPRKVALVVGTGKNDVSSHAVPSARFPVTMSKLIVSR